MKHIIKPDPHPRARMTGISRKISATIKIRNAKVLNKNGLHYCTVQSVFVLYKHMRFGFERLNAPCEIRHEVAVYFPTTQE